MIQFIQDISEDKLLMAYNNNVVRFKSDIVDKTVLNCSINGLGIAAIIYPNPEGVFYFNLKEYITAAINTQHFNDNVVAELDENDTSTYTYDASEGCHLGGNLIFIINFSDETIDESTKTLNFIAGVEQLESFKKNEILNIENFVVLSPVENRTNNIVYLKYWPGYPFEFSFFSRNSDQEFTLLNSSNLTQEDFTRKGAVTSMVLSDGRTSTTIENVLPLVTGLNILRFIQDSVLQDQIIKIEKVESDCGVYVKWLNKYGRFNYWLFSKNYFRKRSSKNLGIINNDFENLENTISINYLLGRESADVLRCAAEKLYEDEKLILEGILDSPKILLYTGERFSRAESNDWIEVTMKNGTFDLKSPKVRRYSFVIDFELPDRYTQKQ